MHADSLAENGMERLHCMLSVIAHESFGVYSAHRKEVQRLYCAHDHILARRCPTLWLCRRIKGTIGRSDKGRSLELLESGAGVTSHCRSAGGNAAYKSAYALVASLQGQQRGSSVPRLLLLFPSNTASALRGLFEDFIPIQMRFVFTSAFFDARRFNGL